MAKITRVEILQVDLQPQVPRSDAIRTLSMQETPLLRVFSDVATRLERIPQRVRVIHSRVRTQDGHAPPAQQPGLGVEWNGQAIERMRKASAPVVSAC